MTIERLISSRRLETATFDVGDGASVKKMLKPVEIGETSGSRVVGPTLKNNFDVRVRDRVCAVGKITSSMRFGERINFTMLGRRLFVVKLFVCIALLANGSMLVSAAINRKSDIRVDVKVPKEAELGSTANLECKWRVVGEKSLYSVKWYKDDHEFFRYMPNNHETTQMFAQTGIKLDKKVSTEKSIRLTDLTLNSSGQYKCEVSTEGPSFATEYRTGNLTIIKLPERAPQITGLSTHYAVGENVTANCTAWPSIPKATLEWYINDKPVGKEYTIVYPPLAPQPPSGTPNSLGLRLEAETRHFSGGEGTVTILCVSHVGSHRDEAEQTVHMAHVNNQRLSAGESRGGATDKTRTSPAQSLLAVVLVTFGLYAAT